jgi:type I restriction enzyme R subunit
VVLAGSSLVFDFCGNLEYFGQDLPGSEGSLQKSQTQRLFEARLNVVVALDAQCDPSVTPSEAERQRVNEVRTGHVDWLHGMVAGMNLGNVLVRAERRHVETWADRDRWDRLDTTTADEVREHLSGLPTTVHDPDVDAKRFDLLVLRRQLAQLEGDAGTAERVRETVQAIATALLPQTAVPSVAEQIELLEAVAGDEWWVDVTLPMLELMRLRLRGLVRLVERARNNPVYTDFEDTLDAPTDMAMPQVTTGMDWDRFTAKARAYLRQHENHVALQRLRRNKQLTRDDLDSLTDMLHQAAGDHEVDLSHVEERAGDLGLFIRSLVGLDRAAVVEAFTAYLDESRFSVEQVRFVNLVIDELTSNGYMEPGRLYESPDTDLGHVDMVFPDDFHGIVRVLRDVKANAVPEAVA